MEGPKVGQGVVVQGQKGPREPPWAMGTDLGRERVAQDRAN